MLNDVGTDFSEGDAADVPDGTGLGLDRVLQYIGADFCQSDAADIADGPGFDHDRVFQHVCAGFGRGETTDIADGLGFDHDRVFDHIGAGFGQGDSTGIDRDCLRRAAVFLGGYRFGNFQFDNQTDIFERDALFFRRELIHTRLDDFAAAGKIGRDLLGRRPEQPRHIVDYDRLVLAGRDDAEKYDIVDRVTHCMIVDSIRGL
jgi:hypothetical protein